MSRFRAERIHAVFSAPAYMDIAEKALVYGFVAARAPKRVVEVGTNQGGATVLLCAALDDLGAGCIVTVDREARVPDAIWRTLAHRTTQVADVRAVAAELDGPAELVMLTHPVDPGDVTVPLQALDVASGGHVLVHDAHLDAVRAGIDLVLAAGGFADGGLLATEANEVDGATWGGLRLLHRVS
jgi:hypothetical protein